MIPFIRTDKYHKLEKKFLLDKKYFFSIPLIVNHERVMNVGMKWVEAIILFNKIRFSLEGRIEGLSMNYYLSML